MIKIEIEQIIDLSMIVIEQDKLNCSICYCLLINPKMCSNKKCNETFCEECIKTALLNEANCPFCRLTTEQIEFLDLGPNSDLNFVLKNLKLVCKHLKCGKKIFDVNQYIKHIVSQKGNKERDKCTKCNNSTMKEYKKCCLNERLFLTQAIVIAISSFKVILQNANNLKEKKNQITCGNRNILK